MTLKEFLNAYANRHGRVVIKDEYNSSIASGDSWAFVVEQAEEELHEREVELFYFSDSILYVRLKELPDPGGIKKYKKTNGISNLVGLWVAYKMGGTEAIMHGKVTEEAGEWLYIKKSRKHHYEVDIHVSQIVSIFFNKEECYKVK